MKRKYAQKVLKLLVDTCRLMSAEKDEPLFRVLNISSNMAADIINKIMISLPDRQFYNATPMMLHDILGFIVKNYIFFEAQEDINSDAYVYDLRNFIVSLSFEIDARYYPKLLQVR